MMFWMGIVILFLFSCSLKIIIKEADAKYPSVIAALNQVQRRNPIPLPMLWDPESSPG